MVAINKKILGNWKVKSSAKGSRVMQLKTARDGKMERQFVG